MEQTALVLNADGAKATRAITPLLWKRTRRVTTGTSREKLPGEEERGTPPLRSSSTAVVVSMLSCPTPGEDASGNDKQNEQARHPPTKQDHFS